MSCILSKFSNFCAQINDALTFNTEAKKTTITSHLHTFMGDLNKVWSSSNPTSRTKESNEKDYKS